MKNYSDYKLKTCESENEKKNSAMSSWIMMYF